MFSPLRSSWLGLDSRLQAASRQLFGLAENLDYDRQVQKPIQPKRTEHNHKQPHHRIRLILAFCRGLPYRNLYNPRETYTQPQRNTITNDHSIECG